MKFSSTSLKNEKIVLERKYKSILPILIIVLGIIVTIGGLILMIETEIPGAFLLGVILLIVGAVLNAYAEILLVVTNKRVYCDGPFMNYISLPLEHISSVGVHGGGLNIASASGRIIIGGAYDRYMVCDAITALLNGDESPMPVSAQPHRSVTQPKSSVSAQPPRPVTQPKPTPAPAKQRKAEKTEFVFDEGELNPFAEDAEFVDVKCPNCKEQLSFVVGTKNALCPSCGTNFYL